MKLRTPSPRLRDAAAVGPFLLCLPLALVGCSDGGEGPSDGGPGASAQADAVEDVLRRERAAAYLAQADPALGQARAELAPLVARARPALPDVYGAVQVELLAQQLAAARALLERAREVHGDDPGLLYLQARVAFHELEFERELELLRQVHAARPEDRATRYLLANAIQSVAQDLPEDDPRYPEYLGDAAALYAGLEAEGIENATIWYPSAVYRLMQISGDLGRTEEQARYVELSKALRKIGAAAVADKDLDTAGPSTFGAPTPSGNRLAAPPTAPAYAAAGTVLPELADAHLLELHDLDGDRRMDVLASDGEGLWVAIQGEDGGFTPTRILEEPVDHVLAIDLNQDDDWDVVWVRGASWGLVEHDEGAWVPSPVTLPDLPSPALDVLAFDMDHEGDLDLCAVGAFGFRVLRNDGAAVPVPEDDAGPDDPLPERGGFVDVTAETGLPAGGPLAWVLSEDLDGDQDVDLLLGGPEGVVLASSLRAGRFEDLAAARLGEVAWAHEPLAADLDGDGRADLLVPAGDATTLWLQGDDGRFTSGAFGPAVPGGTPLREVDLDLDGVPDVVWSPADRALAGVLAPGLPQRAAFALGEAATAGPAAVADIDHSRDPDLAFEVVRAGTDGLTVWRTDGPVGNALRLRYVGLKDNQQAIGAVVEVRARDRYRRIYWRGDLELLGLGPHAYADIVRITWPNGVVSNDLGLERGDLTLLSETFGNQPDSLPGSCPFLYTWNGETYVFISDVLGITPLGLPMAPGLLVPPDHDEYVLVRGDQLVPRDGVYELQVTEELREVTYLDHARLEVVDHPAGTEIYPDERFTFPPFPEPHTHTVRDPLSATRATGSDGADWTEALARTDDVHAVPFERLPGQFQGLATPHHLELAFDPERVRGATKLRLVCTGWFFWSDASANVASARTPGVDFVPPVISVPTGDGEWAPIGPPVGFPAGKTKSMVIDLTDHLDREDPRLRIGSTLALYWDSLLLAVDADDAPLTVHTLEATSAELWERGFSYPLPADREDLPERFDWDALADQPRWDQHPGRYTRLGECRPLVAEVDDRFVILGSGDCLTLRFDATAVPPVPEGYVRDYLLFLDGWAKDRDPNTVEALEVEPLPFHGMSAYPYGPDERFPDGDTHRAWRAEWNTRPARRAVVPLAPAAFDEWARAGGVRTDR